MESSPTILLVEDDENDLFLILRSIERSRLVNPVRVARDGEQAIQYLAGEGEYSDRRVHPLPFLVLLDLHLPKLNGFEVLRWLRSQPEHAQTKVAVLTASAEERDRRRATELGADSYFIKPGSLEEFVSLMVRMQGHWMLLDGRVPAAELQPPGREEVNAEQH